MGQKERCHYLETMIIFQKSAMQSEELQKQHLRSFAKLSLSKRLSWALGQGCFFARFMDSKAKEINRKLRRNGKRYFKA